MKRIISRELPDSPPQQEGAPDPITGLYVCTFSTLIYFLPKSTSFTPNFNHTPPLIPPHISLYGSYLKSNILN